MSKYECRIMSDGRVVFINNEDIDKAIEEEKELLIIDTDNGACFVIGADKEYNEFYDPYYHGPNAEPEYIYSMYSYYIKDKEITDMTKFSKIVFTHGEKIIMKSGKPANYYFDGRFTDYSDYSDNKLDSGTVVIPNDAPCKVVNMEITIREFEKYVDDGKEKLNCLSGYSIKGLIWEGTKYDLLK